MKYKHIYAADLETTVYDGQTYTEAWSSAFIELYKDKKTAVVHSSLDETIDYFLGLKQNSLIYYHNERFDGEFWLYKLFNMGFTLAKENDMWIDQKEMPDKTIKVSISAMGQWYYMIIKNGRFTIEIRDSLKLLPFTLKKLGKDFKTQHQKLDMEYKGYRYAGCEITPEEREYIINDIMVLKEALEIMFKDGHTSLTIGSCCMKEYKSMWDKQQLEQIMPDLREFDCGGISAEKWIRKAYRGAWCYVKPDKAKQIRKNGITVDVNSLYPSVMSSESGNYYPVGAPHYCTGKPDENMLENKYWFVHIKTRFYLKKDMLPTIQVKGNMLYKPNEWLTTSDIKGKDGKYRKEYIGINGGTQQATVELYLSKTDYALIKQHYVLIDTEYIDYVWFAQDIGIFDRYLNKYRKIKQESKGAVRTIAKLFLVNLYGKLATSEDSSFKWPELAEDGSIRYHTTIEKLKTPGYIAQGAAITSYARYFTITAAQKNYKAFDYADTDSLHLECAEKDVKGCTLHPTNFCAWKVETHWDEAIFNRQKTYIEHVVKEDGVPCEPWYNIKCAGMGGKCKDLLDKSLRGVIDKDYEEFTSVKRTLLDFKEGLKIPGKLVPKHITGGQILVETDFELRGNALVF